MSEIKKKKHADFQDKYRRNSNFGKTEEDLNVDKEGNLTAEETNKKTTKDIRKSVNDVLTSEEEE